MSATTCSTFEFIIAFASRKRVFLRRIHGDHCCAAALHFEAEPAVPRADIEHAFSAQVLRNRKLRDPRALRFDRLKAGNDAPIRQFDAVIIAELGQLRVLTLNVGGEIGSEHAKK